MNLSPPVIKAVMVRRLLVNYRVHPAAAALMVPPPFQPQRIRGWALAGICLIELKQVRPAGLPGWMGLHSIHAAHRIAVTWTEAGRERTGVYVPLRHTNSRLSALAGGRWFPGVHHPMNVVHWNGSESFQVELRDRRQDLLVKLRGGPTRGWPAQSLFGSLPEASEFFRNGSCGWSPSLQGGALDGVELRASKWSMKPWSVDHVESGFFDDRSRFPEGSVLFDGALVMENLEHEWHGLRPGEGCLGPRARASHGPSALFKFP
jgi:hypothetical protein